MRLHDMDSAQVTPSIVLLQTPSARLKMFIQDKLKSKLNCNADTTISIEAKGDYKSVRELTGVLPAFSERWLVLVDLDKTNDKDLMHLIDQSVTCCFIVTCSRYGTFKKFKEDFKEKEGFFDYYINYVGRADLVYLYDCFVPEDKRLSKPLFDYVVQGYSGDIDQLFELLLMLNGGRVFKTRKDIITAIGVGGLTVEGVIFSMTTPLSGSADGLKTVMKNRLKSLDSLADTMGHDYLYNSLSKSLLILCELKMLIISGVVYSHVGKLSDKFDEKSLARYQKHIWRLNKIPLSTLLRMKDCMGSEVWTTDLDIAAFVYKYYSQLSMELIG